jgi:imidazolonepropionase-like amidohydrolase
VTPGLARVEHRRLIADGGRIVAIEPSSQSSAPHRYLLPGLIDMHIHLPPRFAPGLVDLFGSLLLMHGITAIREVGSIDGQAFALARQIEEGRRPGPRVAPCGPVLDGDPPGWPIAQVIHDRGEGESVTRDLAARGARCI